MTNTEIDSAICAARILIVDDMAIEVETAAGFLHAGGFSAVTGVTDPKQGLAIAESGSCDLVLLDMRMPGLGGEEFIRRLRAHNAAEMPAIVVLTAQNDDDTRRAAVSAGARDFITKPFKLWELLQRVRNALEIHILYRRAKEFNALLERRVGERTRELARANRGKSEFLANIHHELRTPINAILGFSDIIMNRLFGPGAMDRYAEYAADINTAGNHLLAIIDDILALSKIEDGEGRLDESNVRVETIAHETARILFRDRFERAGLTLAVDLPAPGLLLHADERKLKQALSNLLSNALKFTPRGGTVTLTTVTDADCNFGLVVRDTGIGIAADDIETVLTPFGQVESAYRRQHHGAGLGLPLARALIELHGGRLTLTSELGVGTVVTLWLPAQRLVDPAVVTSSADGTRA
ncbi:MAG TPA: hybrid sensor histidine kinase/response regulator [Micropepsaceae bacterium]|nr:hybrid sensor histidine kinase/response regulator [Micropepsaceae bacterium]